MTVRNPLSPGPLADIMAVSLRPLPGPHLQSPYDAIALFGHACMVAVGFQLVGLGEENRIPRSDDEIPALPKEWNASSSSSSYAFRYCHLQSSMEYLVKVNRMGSKAVVLGMGIGDDRTATFDALVREYVSEAAFPASLSSGSSGQDDGEGRTERGGEAADAEHRRSMADALLQRIFVSPSRMSALSSLFKENIIQKIMPGLHKEGYQETSPPLSSLARPGSSSSSSQRQSHPRGRHPDDDHGSSRPRHAPPPRPARPYPFDDPLAMPPPPPPLPPFADFPPPRFEDEYDLTRPPRGGPPGPPAFGGARNPFNIGHDDLYPPGLGPYDPFDRAPGGGGLPRPGGGDGMHPTFDDHLFHRRGDQEYDSSRQPPGARYDPVGPGDPPSGRGGLGGGRAGRGGGGGPFDIFRGGGGGDSGAFGYGFGGFGGSGGGGII